VSFSNGLNDEVKQRAPLRIVQRQPLAEHLVPNEVFNTRHVPCFRDGFYLILTEQPCDLMSQHLEHLFAYRRLLPRLAKKRRRAVLAIDDSRRGLERS